MTTQLHLAYGIVEGRIHSDEDPAQRRSIQLARRQERRARRAARRTTR
ncbi:hypothetical protein [Nocardioides sp. Soil805]|nr:hypothetical protein [Nocardioides sp. Soil805]